MQARLTQTVATKAGPGLYWDSHKDAPRGFLLRVTAAGARAWCLNYRLKDSGRERRLTIGDVATWPVEMARKKAAELRRVVDEGGDPLGQLEDKRAAPTFAGLAADYEASSDFKRLAKATQVEYRSMLRLYILPALGSRKVAGVTRDDVEKLHRRITEQGMTRRANSVKSLCRTIFAKAIRDKQRGDNPASGIKNNPEHNRERYLTGDEIERLMTTLDRWQERKPDSCDALRLLMLTGARRGEALAMRWADVELDTGVWSKPYKTTKQRQPHRVPLNEEAVALLRRRNAERDGPIVRLHRDEHVFRGGGDVAHIGRLERDWREIRAAAGLEDVRIHDLRHSFASVLVGQGLSLPIIGAMLGHSRPATTHRYAHLADAPLREAAAIVGKIVTNSKR